MGAQDCLLSDVMSLGHDKFGVFQQHTCSPKRTYRNKTHSVRRSWNEKKYKIKNEKPSTKQRTYNELPLLILRIANDQSEMPRHFLLSQHETKREETKYFSFPS